MGCPRGDTTEIAFFFALSFLPLFKPLPLNSVSQQTVHLEALEIFRSPWGLLGASPAQIQEPQTKHVQVLFLLSCNIKNTTFSSVCVFCNIGLWQRHFWAFLFSNVKIIGRSGSFFDNVLPEKKNKKTKQTHHRMPSCCALCTPHRRILKTHSEYHRDRSEHPFTPGK